MSRRTASPAQRAIGWWDKTDLLIGIGSRLELQYFRWPSRPPNLKLVRIDIDAAELARLKPNAGIHRRRACRDV